MLASLTVLVTWHRIYYLVCHQTQSLCTPAAVQSSAHSRRLVNNCCIKVWWETLIKLVSSCLRGMYKLRPLTQVQDTHESGWKVRGGWLFMWASDLSLNATCFCAKMRSHRGGSQETSSRWRREQRLSPEDLWMFCGQKQYKEAGNSGWLAYAAHCSKSFAHT